MAKPTPTGTPTLDNPGSGGTNENFTHTVASGVELLKIVCFAYDAAGAADPVTSVNWDTAGVNESLTQLGSSFNIEFAANRQLQVSVWYKQNPTAGATKNIQVVYGATQAVFAAVAMNYNDVHATTPMTDGTNGSGNSQTPSVTTTTTTSDAYVFGAMLCATRLWGGTMTPGSGVTELQDFATGAGGGDRSFGLFRKDATGGSDTVDASTTQAANDWGMRSYQVNGVAAAGTSLPIMRRRQRFVRR